MFFPGNSWTYLKNNVWGKGNAKKDDKEKDEL